MARLAADVVKDFRLRGESIADWARQNHFNPGLVYQVLRAQHVPLRGESHRIAIALGLKDPPIVGFHKGVATVERRTIREGARDSPTDSPKNRE